MERQGPWCLIGGLAVNCYVEPVYTIDADLVVVSENLARVRAELIASEFLVREFPHSLNAQRQTSKLRLQLATDERYQEFIARAVPREVLGVLVPVASLNDLVQGKMWAWRDEMRRVSKRKKDELDLLRLAEAYPDLRSALPREITAQLDEKPPGTGNP